MFGTGFALATIFTSGLQPAYAVPQIPNKPKKMDQDPDVQVYFGCGSFLRVQYEMVKAEQRILKRSDDQIQSFAGYAGGTNENHCFKNDANEDLFGKMKHGQVVGMTIPQSSFTQFAEVFFSMFDENGDRPEKLFGYSQYRHMVGIPGGMSGPLFQELKKASNGRFMFKEGKGDDVDNLGFSSVLVYDSDVWKFHQAELQNQFRDGLRIQDQYPEEYNNLKKKALADGRLKETGCPNE